MSEKDDYIIIQFRCPIDIFERSLPYIKDEKNRSAFGLIAYEEYVARREGRDERAKSERLMKDKKLLKEIIGEMIEKGELQWDRK